MSSNASAGATFVDLDGTLVLDNSFHVFLWAMAAEGTWRTRLRLVIVLAARRFLRQDRVVMKRKVLAIYAALPVREQNAIVGRTLRSLRRTVSEPVLEWVRKRRAEGPVVLATAAAECYARPLAAELDLDDCLATPATVGPGWQELHGAPKARACAQWLVTAGLADASFDVVSDHEDDLPLMRGADLVFVQARADRVAHIRAALPPQTRVEVGDPEAEQTAGGLWLWLDDAPRGPHDLWEVKTVLSKHRYALGYCGDGEWRRVRPGDQLDQLVRRVDCPAPPPMHQRVAVLISRSVIRDRLGVYH